MDVNATDGNPLRRLRLFLRDHRVVDADARVPNGHFLATYLGTRKRYVNLTNVAWVGTGETIPHMALKVGEILWASSPEGALPLTGAPASATVRRVEMELEGGYLLSAGLLLMADQRLSDYLQAAPAFVPLRAAELRPRGRQLGDIVVNQEAIQLVREVDAPQDDDEAATGADDAADAGDGGDAGDAAAAR